MSSETYQPYHRKYRSKTFAEYIGNTKMKNSIMASLRGTSRPQVLLYEGTAGCGKTTMARLTAKEYLCEDRDDMVGACGKCYSCQRIEEYIETGDEAMLSNVNEVDVTGSNKKQDIEELLEDASIPAFDNGWKIYILDECHELSKSAQNRLLKNLEEPADNVLMILCTTDPEKLLPTILSRCQYTFGVTKPTRDELGQLLARVCTTEGVKYEARALSLVCVKGDFVPRRTLISLEQVVREKQSVTYEDTVEVLNLVADKYFFDFYNVLLAESIDIYKYVTYLGNLKTSMDLKTFVESLITFTMRGIYINNGVNVEALDKSEITQYKKLFAHFNVGDIAYLLNTLLSIRKTKDVEARLLLLGYTGLKRPTHQQTDGVTPTDMIDETAHSAGAERKVGDNNYIEGITMQEEEKEAFIADYTSEVSADTLATLFGGTKVEL